MLSETNSKIVSEKKQELVILKVEKQQTISLINSFDNENAVAFVLQEKSLTITNAIAGTPLSLLEKIDFKKTVTYLIFLLKRINDLINVKHKLNDLQLATLASDLMDFCQDETLEDIVILLKMARRGQLGDKIYKLDTLTIFQEWMPAYLDLKYQRKEQLLEKEKSDRAKAEMKQSQKAWTKEQKDAFDKVYRGLITDKKPQPKPKESYLQNSDSLKKVLKEELKQLTKNELKKLIKEYSIRQSHQEYKAIAVAELQTRKTNLKSN